MRDRYWACLVAGAIGDALGRPAEGRWRADLHQRWPRGLRDYQPWRAYRSGPVGTFTDDTQLTIVVARWLVEMGHGDLEAGLLAEAIELWGETGRGIGHATHEALERMRSGRPWWESGVASAGNGAAMRAAPYALRFAGEPDRLRYSAALGSVPDRELPSLAHRETGERRTLVERIEEVGEMLGRPEDEVLEHIYNGAFVLETTPMVLSLLLTYGNDPTEALVNAVMGGRDADSIAAMLETCSALCTGPRRSPRWRGENLEEHDGLVALADTLYDLRWNS